MLSACQQRRPAPLVVCGSDRERLVVLLALVWRESSICVRPLVQVSIRHINRAPAGPGPLEAGEMREAGKQQIERRPSVAACFVSSHKNLLPFIKGRGLWDGDRKRARLMKSDSCRRRWRFLPQRLAEALPLIQCSDLYVL